MSSSQMESDSVEHSDLPMLVVQFGSTRRKDRPLNRVTTILGRSRACDVTLDAPDVAAIHCLITRSSEGELFIRDCQSRSGTLLNEQPIREALAKDGDTLQVGPFTFMIRIPKIKRRAAATQSPSGESATLALDPDLAASMADLEQRKAEWEEQNRQLQQQISAVEHKQTKLDQALKQLNDERTEETRTNEETKRQLEQQRKELENWRSELEQKQAGQEPSTAHIDDDLRKQIEAEARQRMRQEIERGELSVLNTEIDRLSRVVQQANRERDEMAEKLRESQDNAHLAADDLARQIPDLTGEIARLLQEVEVASQRCEAIAAERDALKSQLHSLPEGGDASAPAEVETIAENERLRQELETANQTVAKQDEKLRRMDEESNRKLASLRAELDDERRRTRDLVREAAGDYERTRNEIATLKNQLESVGAGYGDPNALAELQSENGQLRQEIASLRTEISSRPSVPNDLAEYENQLNDFRASLENAQNQLETQEQEMNERIKQAELQMSKDRANLARQQSDLERIRTELRVELEHAEREANVQAKLAPLQRLKDEMRQEQAAQPAQEGSTPLTERIRNLLKRMG